MSRLSYDKGLRQWVLRDGSESRNMQRFVIVDDEGKVIAKSIIEDRPDKQVKDKVYGNNVAGLPYYVSDVAS